MNLQTHGKDLLTGTCVTPKQLCHQKAHHSIGASRQTAIEEPRPLSVNLSPPLYSGTSQDHAQLGQDYMQLSTEGSVSS